MATEKPFAWGSFDALAIGDECTYEAVLDETKGKAAAKNIVLKNGNSGGGGGGGRPLGIYGDLEFFQGVGINQKITSGNFKIVMSQPKKYLTLW